MPKLQLQVTHTHAGVAYPAGHILDVDEYTARWLTERDIGAPVSSNPVPAPDPADAPKPRSAKTPKE